MSSLKEPDGQYFAVYYWDCHPVVAIVYNCTLIALNCTALYCPALHCIVLQYTTLYCTVLYCTKVHFTTLQCNITLLTVEFPVIIPLTTQVSPAPSVKLRLEWVYGYRYPDLAPATASGPAPGPHPAPAYGPSLGTSLVYAVTLEDGLGQKTMPPFNNSRGI